jgi:hypothetical protein
VSLMPQDGSAGRRLGVMVDEREYRAHGRRRVAVE